MKFEKAMVTFIDLGEEEILTTSVEGKCKNHGHDNISKCDGHGNQTANGNVN